MWQHQLLKWEHQKEDLVFQKISYTILRQLNMKLKIHTQNPNQLLLVLVHQKGSQRS
jgi:hypothetical protein